MNQELKNEIAAVMRQSGEGTDQLAGQIAAEASTVSKSGEQLTQAVLTVLLRYGLKLAYKLYKDYKTKQTQNSNGEQE